MPRWFNTAGPCRPEHHYMLPATRRLPEGTTIPGALPPDDVRFAVDLGLIHMSEAGASEIANPSTARWWCANSCSPLAQPCLPCSP